MGVGLQSVFISYGGPDAAIAERLYGELKSRGVKTFLFDGGSISMLSVCVG